MRVGLFVTCLVDLMRPSIGFAAIRLLEGGGADVYVPPTQTCCGQPAYNSGDREERQSPRGEGREPSSRIAIFWSRRQARAAG